MYILNIKPAYGCEDFGDTHNMLCATEKVALKQLKKFLYDVYLDNLDSDEKPISFQKSDLDELIDVWGEEYYWNIELVKLIKK